MIQSLANAGPQPADIFKWRQNGCNLLLYLTTKHVFENFERCNCPVSFPSCGPDRHLLCMEYGQWHIFHFGHSQWRSQNEAEEATGLMPHDVSPKQIR